MKERGLLREQETVSNWYFQSNPLFSNIDKVNTSQMGKTSIGQNGNSRNGS